MFSLNEVYMSSQDQDGVIGKPVFIIDGIASSVPNKPIPDFNSYINTLHLHTVFLENRIISLENELATIKASKIFRFIKWLNNLLTFKH